MSQFQLEWEFVPLREIVINSLEVSSSVGFASSPAPFKTTKLTCCLTFSSVTAHTTLREITMRS